VKPPAGIDKLALLVDHKTILRHIPYKRDIGRRRNGLAQLSTVGGSPSASIILGIREVEAMVGVGVGRLADDPRGVERAIDIV
jgi:hypothetical protein